MIHATRVVFVVVLLGAATTFAQPAIDQAKQLHEQATADYKLGQFEKALSGYEAAFKLYAAPAFLFNIAQCHFQLQHWERAVFFFEGYLRETPDAPNRQLVEELMREAKVRGAAQRDTETRKLDLERQRLDLEKKERDREAQRRAQLSVTRIETPPERPLYKKWWFWTLVGGAVAGATTTLVLTSGKTVLPAGSLGTLDQR